MCKVYYQLTLIWLYYSASFDNYDMHQLCQKSIVQKLLYRCHQLKIASLAPINLVKAHSCDTGAGSWDTACYGTAKHSSNNTSPHFDNLSWETLDIAGAGNLVKNISGLRN